ncbi:OsmC family peroxiredoxin [Agromyces seonyuensis]|uniref:OsmC family peroxiredoxin n=1 Tax=Agromyces seonyuensis TaxID=2662446 RepID=A0A6I4NU56_9MICO|nr:OsmC family peroxiredoxin [Agromyces seonyuensis]MWB97986.1 OsmC family peroxiredoxin [Agromyces seonyuensis]
MAITSEATTVWNGTLFEGEGTVSLDSSQAAELRVDWKTRAEGGVGTSTPEELIAAAHSSCFSMAFSNALTQAGFPPTAIQTTAAVTFQPGTGILGSHLLVNATVPGVSDEQFAAIAEDAKANCPVSQALAAIPITLEASLA